MIHIFGGGTFSHVRSHLALAAPAFGKTARFIHGMHAPFAAQLHLTRMADPTASMVTNADVAERLAEVVADPLTRVIYMNAALCDYEGQIDDVQSGKHAERLQSRRDRPFMQLRAAEKLIGSIRHTRKDIFAVGFKTTAGATEDEQYAAALNALKRDSLNLVLANDVVTRVNMIVAPEETRYSVNTNRQHALENLVSMTKMRSRCTFTRSTVEPGPLVDWATSPLIPDSLRTVVSHLVQRGAYKPFRGATAGHFAVRVSEGECLTSRRKTDYTAPGGLDLVRVEYDGLDRVLAHGAKPSVGGQSQRVVFQEHEGLDCIVHAHVPLRPDAPDVVPVAPQAPYECGSHQCGQNTSRNLQDMGGGVHCVMLDNHGPNVVFGRDTDPQAVIAFLERNFVLEGKTGGLVSAQQQELVA